MAWRRWTAALLAAAALGSTAGCSASAPAAPTARVTVRIQSEDRPLYEVRLKQADGAFAAEHRMRPGETRTFTVPAGWLTVRVPGLCVIPTPNRGSTTVDVQRAGCTVA